MCGAENNTNECICKTKTDSQITTNLWLPKGEAEDELIGSLGSTDTNYYM